jgi:competence protein ComEC
MNKTSLVVAFLVCIFCGWLLVHERPSEHAELIVCDVGQGDAILFVLGSWQLLVDGGPDDAVVSCLARHMPMWDRTIEVIVATHPDKDHIGGLRTVLERFHTPLLLMEWSEKESTDFEALKAVISSKQAADKLRLLQPARGQVLQLGEKLRAEVLSSHLESAALESTSQGRNESVAETQLWDASREKTAQKTGNINYNERSIVLLLSYEEVRILLTGDLEHQGEQALLRQGLIEPVSILKVGHHGSKTSTSEAFLHALQPETALISAGKKNSFGHPSPEVIARLHTFSTEVFSTSELGELRVVFSNQGYAVFP